MSKKRSKPRAKVHHRKPPQRARRLRKNRDVGVQHVQYSGGGRDPQMVRSLLELPPEIYPVTELHILGREAGRAICGAKLPSAPANPNQRAWGPLAERAGAFDGIDDAIATATLALPGDVTPCRGCLTNAGRMRASDAAKLAGGRGAARTKAQPIEKELEEQREAPDYNDEDDES